MKLGALQLKRSMVYIDTNIIIRYLLKDNEVLFKLSEDVIETESDLFVPNEIIAEVVYVLTKILQC